MSLCTIKLTNEVSIGKAANSTANLDFVTCIEATYLAIKFSSKNINKQMRYH